MGKEIKGEKKEKKYAALFRLAREIEDAKKNDPAFRAFLKAWNLAALRST